MTQRERQILQWIEENPMISQEELAQKAGISRSSIAVHISNLMKKGYIAGKYGAIPMLNANLAGAIEKEG